MHPLKYYAACLMAATILAAAPAQAAPAAGVVLKNEMELGIKTVSCVNDAGTATQIAGALKADSSAGLSPGAFPEGGCKRIAVYADDDAAWQFYLGPDSGAAREIVFSMDKANPNAEESYPALLMELPDDTHVVPAGVPLSLLVQSMQFGMDVKMWEEIDTPGYDSLQDSGTFAVAFADVSWHLAGMDGIVFSELVPGRELASSVTLSAPFSNTTVLAVLEGLKSMGGAPVLLLFGDSATALTEEGKKIAPEAGAVSGTPTEESRWQAVDGLLQRAADADGGEAGVVFTNEEFVFHLTLDLNGAAATLLIDRKEEAPFG